MFHGPTTPVEPLPLTVGDTIRLDDDHDWTIKAVTPNFAALTRPITDADRKAAHERCEERYEDEPYAECDCPDPAESPVYYTVIDWREGVRGPCNLSGNGWGDGTYTDAECAEMLAEFESGDLEVSHRNQVPIRVRDGRII